MFRVHHVNLTIPVDGEDAEAAFLMDMLDFSRVPRTPETPPRAKWFVGLDGTQIHLSEDPEHHPSSRAHIALELGEFLSTVKGRLDDAGYDYRYNERGSGHLLFCQDPAGNSWELRDVFDG